MLRLLERFDRKELGLILTLVVVTIVALLVTSLVAPRIKGHRSVVQMEATLSKVVENGDDLERQLEKLEGDIDSLKRRLHGDMASLPEKEIEAFVIGKLQRLSWRNGIKLVGTEPSVGDTIETFREMLFRVQLVGNYFDMYQWLQDVSDELGFVLIKQYEMRPINSLTTEPGLSVTLTMATYRALQ